MHARQEGKILLDVQSASKTIIKILYNNTYSVRVTEDTRFAEIIKVVRKPKRRYGMSAKHEIVYVLRLKTCIRRLKNVFMVILRETEKSLYVICFFFTFSLDRSIFALQCKTVSKTLQILCFQRKSLIYTHLCAMVFFL